jgi:hypothetical protein
MQAQYYAGAVLCRRSTVQAQHHEGGGPYRRSTMQVQCPVRGAIKCYDLDFRAHNTGAERIRSPHLYIGSKVNSYISLSQESTT